jgi:hypothetical protein
MSEPRVAQRVAAAFFRAVSVVRVPQERGVRGEDMAAKRGRNRRSESVLENKQKLCGFERTGCTHLFCGEALAA